MTATLAKLEANRRNARRAQGPTTPSGKAIASQNATTHGLLSRVTVLDVEDRPTFDGFADAMRGALAPKGELEALLADCVIACAWRLRRVHVAEVGVFAWRKSQTVGATYLGCDDALAKLSRYEAAIERSMYRALHELQRLQAARGESVPAPAVVDVSITHHDEPHE